MSSLSVLVPVYNEQHLVAASLGRLAVLESSTHLERIQVVVVDDASKDGTPHALAAFAEERGIALAPAPLRPRATEPARSRPSSSGVDVTARPSGSSCATSGTAERERPSGTRWPAPTASTR